MTTALIAAAYPERLARRRAMRDLIFRLLEVRYRLLRHNPDELVAIVRALADDVGGEVPPAAVLGQVVTAVLAAAENTLAPVRQSAQELESAVRALAPLDPLGAYRLSGVENWGTPTESIPRYVEQFVGALTKKPSEAEATFLEGLKSHMLSDARDTGIERLGELALLLARKTSWIEWYRTWRVLCGQQLDPVEIKELREKATVEIKAVLERAGVTLPDPLGGD